MSIGAVIGLVVSVGLLGVALGLPLYLIARKPTLRRLAFRNATRRPRETVLVLLGSMLGTAIITSSFVVGDTLDSSIRRSAFTQLGPTDALVFSIGGDPQELSRKLEALPDDLTDGALPARALQAAVTTVGEDRVAEPSAVVLEIDFAQAAAFGGDADATGITGASPAAGQAVVGADLALALSLDTGDTISVNAYGASEELTVDRVLPRLGVAGFGGMGSETFNLFVAPGTIEGLRGRGTSPGAPPSGLVLLSAPGGVLEGGAGAEALAEAADGLLGESPARAEPVKANLLEAAESVGDQFTELFGAIGFFSVLAGVLLLVNIFVMLAQERKVELGMLRAVGLRRASLIGAFHLEGWLYAVVSSVIGLFAGIGLGRIIVAVATGIFSRPGEEFSLELNFATTQEGILQGFQLGFMISVLTVFTTAIWVSRLNVIRAIRDLPEPESTGHGLRRVILGTLSLLLGGALTLGGISGQEPLILLAGPAIAAAGLVQLLRPLIPRRALVSLASMAVIAWEVVAFQVFPDTFDDAPIPTFVVQGVCLTAAAVSLVSQNQDVIGGFIRRLAGGSSMSLRLGLAYPLARRFRTGMTLSMYALVMFTLTFITVFSHLFGSQIDTFTREISGGFDLVATSNPSQPAPPAEVDAVPGVEAVSVQSRLGAEWKIPVNDDFEPWPIGTYDQVFVDQGVIELEVRPEGFDDDVSVYREVLMRSDLVILPTFFLADNGGGPPPAVPKVGTIVQIRDPLTGLTKDVEVFAHSKSGFGNDLPLVAPALLNELFGERVTPNLIRIVVEDGADPADVARRINGQFLTSGMDAQSFREIASENVAQQQSFFRLMQGYLALGLVVGIAGLGVVMIRAVRERRRQIGVLRSLGFPAAAVRRAFVAESAFVAAEGISIGVILALIVAWRLIGEGTFGGALTFSVPPVQLAVLVLGTFIASLLATAAPAQQASRIRPAVALRLTD